MKIAFFHNLPPGGAYRVMYEEIRFLSKLHAVDLYSYNFVDDQIWNLDPYINKKYAYRLNIDESKKKFGRILSDLKIFFSLPDINKRIAKDIDERKYDVVIIHPDKLIQAPFLLKYLRTPSIYFCHELLRNTYEKILEVDKSLPLQNYLYEIIVREVRKSIEKTNAKKAGIIMTASEYIKTKVKSAYNKDARVVRLGVDANIFKKTGGVKDRTVTFIADKEKITGYGFFKKIAYAKELKRLIKTRVIDHKNNILVLSDHDMAKLLSGSFLTLCTSYNEPFGLTPLESMACGTPVLAVNEGGYRESVIDEVTGYLLKRNKNIFIKKILFLLNNPGVYKKMSLAGIKYIKNNWTWEKHGEELLRQIKILSGKYARKHVK